MQSKSIGVSNWSDTVKTFKKMPLSQEDELQEPPLLLYAAQEHLQWVWTVQRPPPILPRRLRLTQAVPDT